MCSEEGTSDIIHKGDEKIDEKIAICLYSPSVRLKLIIAKNGPDSDRLPSAHTCFIFHIFVSPDANGFLLSCYIRLSYY